MNITELLTLSVQHNASDLHLSGATPPMIRVDGDIIPLNLTDSCADKSNDSSVDKSAESLAGKSSAELDAKQVQSLIYDIMNDKQRKEYEETLETDFSFNVPNLARFRVNAFNTERGPAAVFRTIPANVLSLEQLAAPEVFKQIADKPRGLVLVTGPTGSGKSTTLAAMIDYINTHRQQHILTIEDPIEFVHKNKKSIISQREVHRHTLSFSNALRSALREDPDVILVGELRDLETIRLAMTAAETGHLVFATLHTTSAPKTIDRIIDVFPGDEKSMVRSMLSESLEAVISQTLLKKQGGGRVAVHEIMIGTPAIRNLIREDKVAQMFSTIQMGASFGMQTMEQGMVKIKAQGLI